MLIRNKLNGYTPDGLRVYNFGGGGGGGPTSSTVTQSNIPDWLRPQVENVLLGSMREMFNTEKDADGNLKITGTRPYTPFSQNAEDAVAGFQPLQQRAFTGAEQLQVPGQFYDATAMTRQAGMGGIDAAQQAGMYGGAGYGFGSQAANLAPQAQGFGQAGYGFGSQAANLAPQAQQFGQAGYGFGSRAANLAPQAQMFGRAGYGFGSQAANLAPQAQFYGQGAADIGRQATGLAPTAQAYGQGAAELGQRGLRAEDIGSQVGRTAESLAQQQAAAGQQYARGATDPSSMQAYMSPYLQNVVDAQQQQLQRQADISNQALGASFAQKGAFGGSRQGIAQALANADLMRQKQNVQATGLQNAFQQAQQAQQFGANLGLQGLSGAQQGIGNVLQGGQLGLSGLDRALAGQQAGLQGLGQAANLFGVGLQGQQGALQGLGQAGQAYGLGMQGAETGLRGLGQAGQAYGLGMQGAETGLRGLGQAGQAYGLGMQGAETGLRGIGQAGQAYGLGMQGAETGLRGTNTALQGYDLLGRQGTNLANIGAQQLGAQRDILGTQLQYGGMQQAREQQIINQAMQDFANAQNYPMQQYNAYNALLRGYAAPGYTSTQYQAAPPMASQLAGIGMGAYGLSRMAKGGSVKDSKPKGIAAFATGGIPEVNRKVLFEPNSVSLEQVQQGIKNETISDLIGVPVALQKKKAAQQASAMQAPVNQSTLTEEALAGIDSIPSNLPVRAASGGIISFNGEEESLVPSTADTPKRGTTLASVLAELRQSLGTDRVQSPEVAEYLKAARAAATSPEDAKRQQGMRLLQAGLGVMGGRSPVALQNIAEGIQPALKGYEEDLARQKAAGIASLKAQADIAEARRLERRGEVKDALGLLEKQKELEMRERVSKQHVLTEYAKNYLEMQKAKGDPRSDKEILDEGYRAGFRQYGFAQGRAEAGLAGTALTATTAATTAAGSQDLTRAQLEQNARIAALGAWEKKEFTDPEKRQYRRIQRASGQEAADAYKDNWIKEQISKSAPATPPSPRPPAGQPAPSGARPNRAPEPQQWQIDLLNEKRNDPSYIRSFDQKFGAGSSDKYLK